jgi:hypothetical protein
VKTVTEWVGKTICFPSNVNSYSLTNKVMDIHNEAYKLVLYADSFECSSCNIKLFVWNELMKEIDNEMPGKVDFFFYFQPRKNNADILSLIKRDNFDYPVFFDSKNEIGKLNNFSEMTRQCFLLDKKNKVVLIGDPSHNLMLWDLYKKVISGEDVY